MEMTEYLVEKCLFNSIKGMPEIKWHIRVNICHLQKFVSVFLREHAYAQFLWTFVDF